MAFFLEERVCPFSFLEVLVRFTQVFESLLASGPSWLSLLGLTRFRILWGVFSFQVIALDRFYAPFFQGTIVARIGCISLGVLFFTLPTLLL